MSIDNLLASLSSHGRDFERLCKWILENAPEYRPMVRHVWLWDEWPGRWGRDAGIDLVAEDREGGLWGVQAKHYDPAYAIKKADLDSFLSESSRAGFTYRLLIATTDHVGPTARNTLVAQEKPVGMLLRSQLEGLEVVWPTSLGHLTMARPKRKRLRPHQRAAIEDCVVGLASADRGQLVMACGTGKTLVGPFLAERIAAKSILVLVPSLSLLGQTLREWGTAAEFEYLAVCSDDTVTKDEQDAVVASTSELGIPVTTDPDRIARFLRASGDEVKVTFATYQSSPQIAAAQKSPVPHFDLVIADEAHRCAGPEAGIFATVLSATKIRARKRLFMTATPRYYTGRVKQKATEAEWEVASMDEEAKFGSVFHRLTFAQAINQELLCDYQVVVVGVSDDEAYDLAERGAFVTRDSQTVTDARTLARQIGLLRAMAEHDLHRVVSFHSRIDHASRFAASLPETQDWLPADRRPAGSLWTDHVSGKMTAGERDVRLRRLKAVQGDERGLLANARCLAEGVDVPTLDGVAFIDPRRSQVDVVQAVGRAIRLAEGKTIGTIVIPVLIEEEADPEDALASSEFDRLWQIVRALRDHDEDLAEELDELRRGLGRRGSLGARPKKIVYDLPVRVGDAFIRAFNTLVVENSTAAWEFWYGLLERFAASVGHARVPQHHRENDYHLGEWVHAQRRLYRAGELSPDRITRLEVVPNWTWGSPRASPSGSPRGSRQKTSWNESVTHLEQFIARMGHARVPFHHRENGYLLGRWVSNQRSAYRTGNLSAERIARLEALPHWTWDALLATTGRSRVPREVAFEEGFSHLEQFIAREGHARVPTNHRENDYLLGSWVSNQRYRKERLSTEQIARLEALPEWRWRTRKT